MRDRRALVFAFDDHPNSLFPYACMPLTLYFLRHGQTANSRDNVFCGDGLDPDLTDGGQEMAEAFAQAYQNVSWRAIYTGPLKRTIQTAEPISHATGVTPQVRPELREIGYGAWEGKSVTEVQQQYADDYNRWLADPAWNAPTGGEPASALANRALRFVDEVRRGSADGNVLVVSHKATIRVALCGLLGLDIGRFRVRLGCPVGSVSVVEFGTYGPLLHRLADRTHLDARLRELPGT